GAVQQSVELGFWVGGVIVLGPLVIGSVVAITFEAVAAVYRGFVALSGRGEPPEPPPETPPPPKPKPPRVAGLPALDRPLGIDFGKPYDFYFARLGYPGSSGEEPLVFRRCTLLGFTSALLHGEPAEWDGILVAEQTISTSRNRWLVLRRPEGRL